MCVYHYEHAPRKPILCIKASCLKCRAVFCQEYGLSGFRAVGFKQALLMSRGLLQGETQVLRVAGF